ncbi:histidine phosphatase family protein [Isoptericola sp. b441]|uniref:Histidine phosphatase family protein n=1 Tax=Actinotalea lenta TaxID=3064654 RepID=A0ABT9D9D2_9CELL|nr:MULTISPECIES: histidine phosphatase family protein [unclassified Isoptericola]MDO8107512.1 histidine phosphatase family protein [Isoptericola sp. b441]MDO8120828.1 histidine phosphatase family protein [Isoptericola sp. b490]
MTTPRPGGRRLVLLRHAKAEPAGGVSDELRPLAVTGRRQCVGVGQRLATSGLVPEQVLVSSAVRTRQTWDLVRQALGDIPEPELVVTDELYDAGPRDVMALVRRTDERVATVLVVGHEPTMSVAATLLADPTPPVGDLRELHAGLPTAGFAVLEVQEWVGVDRSALRLLEVVRSPH